jgi:hypothetical protein
MDYVEVKEINETIQKCSTTLFSESRTPFADAQFINNLTNPNPSNWRLTVQVGLDGGADASAG